MAPFRELQGTTLRIAVWTEACFAIMIFGYNQAAAGGVVGSPEFTDQFPRMKDPTIEGELYNNNQEKG